MNEKDFIEILESYINNNISWVRDKVFLMKRKDLVEFESFLIKEVETGDWCIQELSRFWDIVFRKV